MSTEPKLSDRVAELERDLDQIAEATGIYHDADGAPFSRGATAEIVRQIRGDKADLTSYREKVDRRNRALSSVCRDRDTETAARIKLEREAERLREELRRKDEALILQFKRVADTDRRIAEVASRVARDCANVFGHRAATCTNVDAFIADRIDGWVRNERTTSVMDRARTPEPAAPISPTSPSASGPGSVEPGSHMGTTDLTRPPRGQAVPTRSGAEPMAPRPDATARGAEGDEGSEEAPAYIPPEKREEALAERSRMMSEAIDKATGPPAEEPAAGDAASEGELLGPCYECGSTDLTPTCNTNGESWHECENCGCETVRTKDPDPAPAEPRDPREQPVTLGMLHELVTESWNKGLQTMPSLLQMRQAIERRLEGDTARNPGGTPYRGVSDGRPMQAARTREDS